MKRIFDLKTFGVFLSRNKFYTLVNVLGFSVSMMFVILIMLYAQQENSVDKCIDKADRIYSVCVYGDDNDKDILEGTHWQTQKALMKSFPQLETTCGVATERLETTVEEKPIQMTTVFTDSTFFRIFSFPMVQGDRQHVLDDMQAAVVEENFARRMWGGENPIGKRITLNEMEGLTVHVTGVYRNPGRTSLGKSDLIIRFEHMDKVNDYITAPHMGNASGALVFLLAKPGNDLSQMGPAFDEAYKQMGFWVYKLPGRETHTKLLRFSDRYFSKAYPAQYGGAVSMHGDKRLVNILFAVGLAILLFAVFNYVNLSTAQGAKRAKEMATRRLMGAQRGDVLMRLIMESMCLCMCSFLLSTAMAWSVHEYAGSILQTEIDMLGILEPTFLCGMLALVLVTGGVTGLMPAVIISRVRPIDVVRGSFRMSMRMTLSRVFIVLQNAATIVMLTLALTIYAQTHHLIHAPMGYDTEHLMVLDNICKSPEQWSTLLTELKKLSCVEGASACAGYPFQGGNNNTFTHEGKTVSLQVMIGDSCFFKVTGLKVARDNKQADPTRGIWVNRQFLAEIGGLEDSTRSVFCSAMGNEPIPLNGVMEDFAIRNVTSEQHPVMIQICEVQHPWDFLVRVRGDEAEAFRQVDQVYHKVTGKHMGDVDTRPYVMQKMSDTFKEQQRMGTIMAWFAVVAIMVSVLGLMAMSTFFIQQCRREVAVRKVFGSTASQVQWRLTRTFLSHTAIAFLLSAPAAWWLSEHWLMDYSYRIAAGPGVALAGAVCLLTSLMAVIVQVRQAATENPALHIKDE
ncbi:MAG: ABC transporter permease [Bacteroidaceae bacterium]